MTGTVLLFRDVDDHPLCQVALVNGDRVQLALDAGGLVVSRLGPPGPASEVLYRAPTELVAALCAGLVGPKRQTEASPLRILAVAVQAIESSEGVSAAFREAAASLL
jgi:hypothetical protein